MTLEDRSPRRVSGFMENGFAVAMVAVVAFLLARDLSSGGGADLIAFGFVQTAFRIALLLMLVQGVLEIFGREGLLLRPDWQRFGGFVTALAMMACGAALMTCTLPLLFA